MTQKLGGEKPRPALLVFQGGPSPSASAPERLVADAQSAATLDLLARAAASGAFTQAFLITEQTSLADAALSDAANWQSDLPLAIVSATSQNDKAFHFGETLRNICQSHNLERIVYIGGGAMPLATNHDLSDIALAVSGTADC